MAYMCLEPEKIRVALGWIGACIEYVLVHGSMILVSSFYYARGPVSGSNTHQVSQQLKPNPWECSRSSHSQPNKATTAMQRVHVYTALEYVHVYGCLSWSCIAIQKEARTSSAMEVMWTGSRCQQRQILDRALQNYNRLLDLDSRLALHGSTQCTATRYMCTGIAMRTRVACYYCNIAIHVYTYRYRYTCTTIHVLQ